MWLLSIAQIDPQFLVGFSHRPKAGIGNTDRHLSQHTMAGLMLGVRGQSKGHPLAVQWCSVYQPRGLPMRFKKFAEKLADWDLVLQIAAIVVMFFIALITLGG